MKTKDIMKILKLVKKSRKHKKRKRHHTKKVIIAPTQNIQPSALQPYEISRQVPMTGTNNLSLDNLRLTNTLLENKIKEGPEINTRLNDLNTKLLLNETNTNALNNQFSSVNQQLLGLGNASQAANTQLSNQLNNVRQRLIGFDNTNQAFNNVIANQDIRNQLAISNYNKNLENKIDDIWRKGPQLINDAINRKFVTPRIVDNRKVKIDRGNDDDDDDSVEEVINFETKSEDSTIPNPPDKPPNIQQSVPLQTPIQLKPRKRIIASPDFASKFEDEIKAAIIEVEGKTTTDLDKEDLLRFDKLLRNTKVQFGSNTRKKTTVLNKLKSALNKK